MSTEPVLDRYRRRVAALSDRSESRLRAFYERGIERLNGGWESKGETGEAYIRPGHIYENDLWILGPGSLFEYINTARTEIGRRWLSKYLLDPVPHEESVARQEAVRELREQPTLREDLVRIGKYDFSQCSANAFQEWLDAEPARFFVLLPWIAALSAIALVAVLAYALTAVEHWRQVGIYLVGLLWFQAGLGFSVQRRVREILQHSRSLAPEVEILREGLALLTKQSFTSPKLVALRERAAGASTSLRKLQAYMNTVRQRDRDWLYWASIYLMLGTQLAIAIERWRERHGQALADWIGVWGEFEALNSIANHAYEHPEHIFPELVSAPSAAQWEATQLGHPLLSAEHCVRNDVRLDAGLRFYILSGSNMAGKSTLMRAIGVNTVLAYAGGAVRAATLRLTPLRVGASISLSDSLMEGKSRFLAEVERIRAMLEAPPPLLFLIDEIFSGTNSTDRRIAAEAVVRTLIERGAIGLLSTHDLALGDIAEVAELHGSNVHMAARDDAQPLNFDYLLKPGINRQSNALAIARMAGVPV